MNLKSFAEIEITFSDGQLNVVAPPDTLLAQGFRPATKDPKTGIINKGQELPAAWFNWIIRELLRNQRELLERIELLEGGE